MHVHNFTHTHTKSTSNLITYIHKRTHAHIHILDVYLLRHMPILGFQMSFLSVYWIFQWKLSTVQPLCLIVRASVRVFYSWLCIYTYQQLVYICIYVRMYMRIYTQELLFVCSTPDYVFILISNLCMYVCMYVYAYVYTRASVQSPALVQIKLYVNFHVYICTCIHTYIHTYIQVCRFPPKCPNMSQIILIRHTHTHIIINTLARYACIYIYTHIHSMFQKHAASHQARDVHISMCV
jgi:hypothetical protein